MRLRNERFYKILKNLPIPVCGVTLGLAAAGNMLKDYSTILHWLYLTVAAVFWAALLIKLVLCWPDAKKELINPLAFSVFEAYFMTLLQFSAAIAPYYNRAALCLWAAANAGNFILIGLFSWRYLRAFHMADVFTSWNVLYGGNMLAAVVAPAVHMEPAGHVLFWLHFIIFLPWYPLSVYRYWKLPVAEAVRPTICILAAPFNLTLAGYLTGVAHPQLWLVLVFAVIAQLAYVFVLTRLPGILRLPFYPSYGALTFPFVIPAVAMKKLTVYLTELGYTVPAVLNGAVLLEQIVAVVMVTYVLMRYVMYLKKI
ncbi:MAG: TDT family transporter [Peptococcaceae bacterium]|jgi:exfoliative toxin A/B|nr:TDT family transporter [Peptococcaceae bacterium]